MFTKCKYNKLGIQTRNIMKYQNALGKYNRLSYFINPYGLTTMYFLHKVIIKVVTKRDFSIATIKDEL